MNKNEGNNNRQNRRRRNKKRKKSQPSIEVESKSIKAEMFQIEEHSNIMSTPREAPAGVQKVPMSVGGYEQMSYDLKQILPTIAAVATALWRIQTKLEVQLKIGLPHELRHLPRHFQAAWDALASGGIEVQDHQGQFYVPGMAVNPLTFQPVEGLGAEMIIETIKPSVFFKDVLIQRADVIVAQPTEDKVVVKGPGLTSESDGPDCHTNETSESDLMDSSDSDRH